MYFHVFPHTSPYFPLIFPILHVHENLHLQHSPTISPIFLIYFEKNLSPGGPLGGPGLASAAAEPLRADAGGAFGPAAGAVGLPGAGPVGADAGDGIRRD